jgi:hypothetical protein
MGQGYLTNPGTDDQNDLSDIGLTTPAYSEVSPVQLPIRGEKRIIPSFVTIESTQDQIDSGIAAGGGDPSKRTTQIDYSSFVISAALTPFVDFISVVIPHRGVNTQGVRDPSYAATYRFLINPTTVSVNRQTVDQQALTRAGWQFGVWGEDVLQISLQGQTAGQYFAYGLTDQFHLFTESYRNLQQLLMVFENNGYWFEGEQSGQGPLVADFARRRIQKHQDVQLIVGNFIWSGMFDSMNFTKDAEKPFLYDFNITFIAWKERFRSGSPYWDNIHNNIQRGHSYDAYAGSTQLTQISNQTTMVQNLPISSNLTSLTSAPSPAEQAAQQNDSTTTFFDPTAHDLGYNAGTAFLTNPGQFN